ncbi:MAG: hypothetical protein KKC85_20965 [Gammaproteobacteria bacterium]|nr:hypothetical protein [Gammaproteobacteria bacterium]MBU1441416.1 hypothetical protein [Gammaproteobacteria bacterium]MBU2288881.1 hypothetical protein [Gammaproteobacteria bacterium]
MTRPRSHFKDLWGWPIALGCLTAIGLVSALFSDGGVGDAVAWVTLGIPVLVCAWYGWRRKPVTARSNPPRH